MTTGYTPYKREWNRINKARIRTYNRLWMRRHRDVAGTYKKPHTGLGSHSWTHEQKLRARLRLWFRRYNPHLLYLVEKQ
jgi:hypothetical protein